MLIQIPPFTEHGTPPCHEVENPDIFFPEVGSTEATKQIAEAKKVCGECPYKDACLEWAMQGEDFGIWGGLTERERKAERRRRLKAPRHSLYV